MREPESPEQKGRIIIHDQGLGVPSPQAVEQRARELARIAGHAEYTETDYHQARLELSDRGTSPEDVNEMLAGAPSMSEVPGTRGHQAHNYGADDESTVGEQLVEEGLEEALHDEMVEASKRNIREAS